jgi:hypothetical protein
MKNLRLPISFSPFVVVLTLFLASCSTPKQVFYFQQAPATPKVGTEHQNKPPVSPNQQPVFTASTSVTAADINKVVPVEMETKAISKKELRKLLKQQVQLWKDSVPNKSNNRKVTVTGDKQKLKDLKSEVKDLKNSVRVESGDDKLVVNYQQPATELSDTAKILLAVGALIILVALFSIPVIGTLLAAILAVAVVAVALALILGYVEIHGN